MDICETEGVIMKIKDYYKLSSTAAVVLQKYSETWSDWIDIKVEDICDKINVIEKVFVRVKFEAQFLK